MATPTITCIQCGTRVKARTVEQRFCSKQCVGKAQSGSKHPKWKDGSYLQLGYRYILIESGVYAREHIIKATKALGNPLPEGAIVHHHDRDKTNNANSNLVICEGQGYHRTLHKRMRVLAAGGDPDIHRICARCRKALPFASFNKKVSGIDGYASNCRDCERLRRLDKKSRINV